MTFAAEPAPRATARGDAALQRFLILDGLRCLLALCVALDHAGVFPLFGPVGQGNSTLDLLARFWRTTVFGPPAVVAFFLISGFCIHYPFAASNRNAPFWRFYLRRYLRILAPAVLALIGLKLLLPEAPLLGAGSIMFHSTLWSIVCEEIYYGLYPLLNRAAKYVGWARMVAISLVPAAVVSWYYFPAVGWADLGVLPTATVLLPVWLAGCHLAEHVSKDAARVGIAKIWAFRAAAWLTMWVTLVLHFHASLHFTLTAPVVGAVCYLWIRAELRHSKEYTPWSSLVWFGRWSYSLYLVHPIALIIMRRYAPDLFETRLGWTLGFSVVILFSYLFYLAVEKPSHALARRIRLFGAETVGPSSVAEPTPKQA